MLLTLPLPFAAAAPQDREEPPGEPPARHEQEMEAACRE